MSEMTFSPVIINGCTQPHFYPRDFITRDPQDGSPTEMAEHTSEIIHIRPHSFAFYDTIIGDEDRQAQEDEKNQSNLVPKVHAQKLALFKEIYKTLGFSFLPKAIFDLATEFATSNPLAPEYTIIPPLHVKTEEEKEAAEEETFEIPTEQLKSKISTPVNVNIKDCISRKGIRTCFSSVLFYLTDAYDGDYSDVENPSVALALQVAADKAAERAAVCPNRETIGSPCFLCYLREFSSIFCDSHRHLFFVAFYNLLWKEIQKGSSSLLALKGPTIIIDDSDSDDDNSDPDDSDEDNSDSDDSDDDILASDRHHHEIMQRPGLAREDAHRCEFFFREQKDAKKISSDLFHTTDEMFLCSTCFSCHDHVSLLKEFNRIHPGLIISKEIAFHMLINFTLNRHFSGSRNPKYDFPLHSSDYDSVIFGEQNTNVENCMYTMFKGFCHHRYNKTCDHYQVSRNSGILVLLNAYYKQAPQCGHQIDGFCFICFFKKLVFKVLCKSHLSLFFFYFYSYLQDTPVSQIPESSASSVSIEDDDSHILPGTPQMASPSDSSSVSDDPQLEEEQPTMSDLVKQTCPLTPPQEYFSPSSPSSPSNQNPTELLFTEEKVEELCQALSQPSSPARSTLTLSSVLDREVGEEPAFLHDNTDEAPITPSREKRSAGEITPECSSEEEDGMRTPDQPTQSFNDGPLTRSRAKALREGSQSPPKCARYIEFA